MSYNSGQYDDDIRRIKQAVLNNPKGPLAVLAIILLIPLVVSSFYTVQPDEEAVVLRFGKYLKTTQPGLHFKFPLGIRACDHFE